jgi:hypothetical protein
MINHFANQWGFIVNVFRDKTTIELSRSRGGKDFRTRKLRAVPNGVSETGRV